MNKTIFGTDGIRALVGQSPLDFASLPQLGNAIGAWALQYHGDNPHILIAKDTRLSGDWIISALCNGLLLHPLTVSVSEVLPTPTICYLLNKSPLFNIGIVISASHNSYHDNGIKIINSTTGKISKEDETYISSKYFDATPPSYTSYGSLSYYPKASQDYIYNIISLFPSQFLQGIKIVLDCAHGATYQIAPAIFQQFGAQVILLNSTPNGSNINHNCGSLHVAMLQQTVIDHQATIGFAFDGDGDRVIAVNNKGVIKDGDDMLALLTHHPLYTDQRTIVGTIMSNLGLDHYLQLQGKKLIRTKVGDKYITHYINKHRLLLGGEQSGHIILHDYLPTGDGIVTALRLCETIITTNNWDLATFNHYPQIIMNLPVNFKKDLTNPEITSIIENYKAQLPTGRLIVRYSGTENVLRIMIEDQNHSIITQVGTNLAQTLRAYLQ